MDRTKANPAGQPNFLQPNELKLNLGGGALGDVRQLEKVTL